MKKVIFALAICATIVSCQKEEDTKPIDVSKTVYLMDKSWVVKEWTIKADVNDSAAVPQPYDSFTAYSCLADNYLVFNTPSRVSLHEGMSKCDVSAADSTTYGYTLSANDGHLYIFKNPDDQQHETYLEGDMKYISIDTFKITYRLPSPANPDVTQEFVRTYVKFK